MGKCGGKSSVKGEGDPLKQRLVSRTQCRLCGEEGHCEEDCPQADVDMPQAKRFVTFSRHPVGTGVSQAWCVDTWTVAPSAESAETRLKTWMSQEIQESTNLMGVTMTMPDGHAILDCGAALDCIGEVAAAPQRLEKHVALQSWTKFNVSNLEVMAIWWRRRFKLVMPRPGLKRLLFLAALLI